MASFLPVGRIIRRDHGRFSFTPGSRKPGYVIGDAGNFRSSEIGQVLLPSLIGLFASFHELCVVLH